MNKLLLPIFILSITTSMMAQKVIKLPITVEDETIEWAKKEKQFFSTIWNTGVVTNVIKPTMQVFRPKAENNTGTSVIICPGGGMYALSIESEGNMVAEWLAERGVTAFVLKYRLVPTGEDATREMISDGARVLLKAGNILPLGISDGLNALQYVREKAKKYDLDPNKIGIMGFSAGGAVAMGATFNYDDVNKPNFVIPIYAWMDIIPMSPVPADAPPIFVVCASDDPLNLAPASVQIFSNWLAAEKSAELHMFSKGGHGFGMRTQDLPSDKWIDRLGEWMKVQGLMGL